MYWHEAHERRVVPKSKIAHYPDPALDLWPLAEDYLTARGLSIDVAKWNGWYPTRFSDCTPRLVMPASRNDGGTFYQARRLDGEKDKRYLSPAVQRGDSLIIVYPETPATPHTVVIVEGPMDALALAGIGITGIALMGYTPTDETFAHLLEGTRYYDRAYIMLDNEPDAMENSIVIGYRLAGERVRIRPLFLTAHKDFAEVPCAERQAVFDGLVAKLSQRQRLGSTE